MKPFDWLLIALGLYIIACFPMEMARERDHDTARAILEPFRVHGVRVP